MDKSLKRAFLLIKLTFLGLFVATFFTVKIALAGHTQPVDSDYYEKGLRYDQTVASQKEMIASGYHFESPLLSELHPLKVGKQNILVSLKKGNEPITGADMEFRLERNATDSFNKTVVLKEIQPGNYSGELEIPFAESWRVEIKAKTKQGILEKTKQIKVTI
ncbi:nitrogen fixation protein FixH [Leptospira langatensis]|uniref:Nitrogen fixation protein FixH n=1 Tax=Leptospira langatensis TaxID=2484983 RepID=A0A5F1ZZ93_9LEPT|nr:FixH family protein [Leptospira langatensis]TGJ98459.1 nitrogen fixation protein FixH [Leptospira langatensis]TGL43373.1 nitrogen fixation protein FixH [Leptospira langatensis]